MSATINANSADAQLTQIKDLFRVVKTMANEADKLETRAKHKLYDALEAAYDFGCKLIDATPEPGKSLIKDFFEANGKKYARPIQLNPFLGIVQLAFPDRGGSSHSQYAVILRHARVEGDSPAAFRKALDSSGIEGLRSAALDYFGSAGRANADTARNARLQRADDKLKAMTTSAAVALPQGIVAPEGYALVLARIDGSNNAAIIDVIEDGDKLTPTLLKYDDTKRDKVGGVLAPLYEAVNLIHAVWSKADILVCNTSRDGTDICVVQAVSKTYQFPGAIVRLFGHLPKLNRDERWLLSSGDASIFIANYAAHDNWSLAQDGTINADNLTHPLVMKVLDKPEGWRVAIEQRNNDKPLAFTADSQSEFVKWLEQERNDNARQNKNRAQQQSLPKRFTMDVHAGQFTLKMAKRVRSFVVGGSSPDRDMTDRQFAVSDVEGLVNAVLPLETDLHGWFIDNEADDAGLVLEGYIDDHQFSITLPTMVGLDYSPMNADLAES